MAISWRFEDTSDFGFRCQTYFGSYNGHRVTISTGTEFKVRINSRYIGAYPNLTDACEKAQLFL